MPAAGEMHAIDLVEFRNSLRIQKRAALIGSGLPVVGKYFKKVNVK